MYRLAPVFIDAVFISPTRKKDYDNDLIPYERQMYVVIKKKYRKLFSELKYRSYFNLNDEEAKAQMPDGWDDELIFTSEKLIFNLVLDDDKVEEIKRKYVQWRYYRDTAPLPIIFKGSASTLAKLKLMI